MKYRVLRNIRAADKTGLKVFKINDLLDSEMFNEGVLEKFEAVGYVKKMKVQPKPLAKAEEPKEDVEVKAETKEEKPKAKKSKRKSKKKVKV